MITISQPGPSLVDQQNSVWNMDWLDLGEQTAGSGNPKVEEVGVDPKGDEASLGKP